MAGDYIRLSAQQPARRRGRPPGSKNKPKTVISKDQLDKFRAKVGQYLPAVDLEYVTTILEGTSRPELSRDLDIFLALQLKALYPQLADEIEQGKLTREATQRSSIVKELLALRFQMEKQEKGDPVGNQYTFIQNVFDSRLPPERLAALVGTGLLGPGLPEVPARQLPERLSGSVDDDEEGADEARAVSGEVLE